MTNDIISTVQPRKGLKPAEYEVSILEGLWDPKTEGGLLEPDVPAPEDDGKTQEPELGLVLTMLAVPPKSQLVGAGFFW